MYNISLSGDINTPTSKFKHQSSLVEEMKIIFAVETLSNMKMVKYSVLARKTKQY